MNYDKIRNMSDEELEKYLRSLKSNSTKKCCRCEKEAKKVIKITDSVFMQTRSLTVLCDECYQKLLDYLKVNDINWY